MEPIAQDIDLSVTNEQLAASQPSYHKKKKRYTLYFCVGNLAFHSSINARIRVNSRVACKPSNKDKDEDEVVRRRVGGRWYKARRDDLASELVQRGHGVRWYKARRGDPASKEMHDHRIWFRGRSFNLDGTGWKSQTAPENVSFVEHVKNDQLPDEFDAVGLYNVMVEYLPLGTELGPGYLCSSMQEEEHNQILEASGVDDDGHHYYLDCEDYISSDNDEFREFRRKIWYKKEEEKLRKELADYD